MYVELDVGDVMVICEHSNLEVVAINEVQVHVGDVR